MADLPDNPHLTSVKLTNVVEGDQMQVISDAPVKQLVDGLKSCAMAGLKKVENISAAEVNKGSEAKMSKDRSRSCETGHIIMLDENNNNNRNRNKSNSNNHVGGSSQHRNVVQERRVLVPLNRRLLRRPDTDRPHCYLQVQVEQETPFTVVLQLRPDVAPNMVRNFQTLCDGLPDGRGYRGSRIFRAKTDYVAGGDYENNDGTGGLSSYTERHFVADQGKLPNRKGAIRMKCDEKTLDGRCKVSSQFMIWVGDGDTELYRFSLVFGKVVEGLEELVDVSRIRSRQGHTLMWEMRKTVTVIDCGTL